MPANASYIARTTGSDAVGADLVAGMMTIRRAQRAPVPVLRDL